MMMLEPEPLRPCANCKRYGGYTMKRGRSKHFIRICKRCNLKYDVAMPYDNQAKSYIEAVMARADAATGGPWSESHSGDFGMAVREEVLDSDGLPLAESVRGSMQCVIRTPEDQYNSNAVRQGRKDFEFIAHARQDIPTLAKMLLRAIAGLNEMRIRNSWAANVHADELLAEINAMAKGSQ